MGPIRIKPETAFAEVQTMGRKLAASAQVLRELDGRSVQYGCTRKEEVFRVDKVVLYRFRGTKPPSAEVPIVVTYALVNRPYMIDLQEDRSIVRNLLEQGEDVYLIDWGYPDAADRFLAMDDYINRYMRRCIDVVRANHDLEAINLLGICQGGVFSLCFASIYPEKVQNLITMVTPVDFHTPDNMLSNWTQGVDVDLAVDTLGNIPGDLMNSSYLSLKPFRLNLQKYVGLLDVLDDPVEVENFLRMEKWIFDSPDQAGETFRQFNKEFYQENRMMRGGTMVGDKRVDPRNVTMPVLNIFAEQDHLVPPSASTPMRGIVGTDDYSELAFKGGHIGLYVSGRAQREVPGAIHEWLSSRT